MASPATPENEAIRELKSELVTEVKKSLDRIVGEAHTRKLITDDQKEELLELQGTKQQKAEKFMGYILDTVKDPTTMNTFCELLCLPGCIDSQRELAQKLKDRVKIKRNPGEAARKRMEEDSHGDDGDDKPEGKSLSSMAEENAEEKAKVPAVGVKLNSMDDRIFGERLDMCDLYLVKWDDRGEEEHLRVIELIQDKWSELGSMFKIPQPVLKGFRMQYLNNSEDCCVAVLQRWMESGSEKYPITWKGLIKVLNDIGKRGVAEKVIMALLKKTET